MRHLSLGSRGRRIVTICLAVTVPMLLFANVLQGLRYTRLERSVQALEQEQIDWFEKNKSLLAAIGIYSSPRRLEQLEPVPTGRAESTLRIRVTGDGQEGSDGQ